MDKKGSRQQQGFTLIELIAVLIILGIISATAFMRWSPGTPSLNAQADQLSRVLRHAQSLAMAQGRSLRFDVTSATTYAITDGAAVITDPQGVTQNYSLDNGVTLSGNDIDFDSLGRPITAADTLISAQQNWTLNANGSTSTVAIQPLTGFASVTP